MRKRSAGLLMYRLGPRGLEVFLVHPGGPFWAQKDLGAWTIPKGEYLDDEVAIDAARREFGEETGFPVPAAPFLELGSITQKSGKLVSAWAFEGDCDPGALVSNSCEIDWPPRSGRTLLIPEVDRGDWFTFAEAQRRMIPAQTPFLTRLLAALPPIR